MKRNSPIKTGDPAFIRCSKQPAHAYWNGTGDPPNKTCTGCHKSKPLTDFRFYRPNIPGKRRARCLDCERANSRRRYATTHGGMRKAKNYDQYVRARMRVLLKERGFDPLTTHIESIADILTQARREWEAISGVKVNVYGGHGSKPKEENHE